MSGPRFSRALAARFLEELARHQALAPSLERVAVAFRVRDADGAWQACTALLDDQPRLLDGEVLAPGVPAVVISGDEDAWRALFAGTESAAALARAGRLCVEGPAALVQAVAACFAPAADAHSVRWRTQIPRARTRGPT